MPVRVFARSVRRLRRPALRNADRPPDFLRREGDVDVGDAEGREGVDDRVGRGRRCADRRRLADPISARRVERRRCLGVVRLEGWEERPAENRGRPIRSTETPGAFFNGLSNLFDFGGNRRCDFESCLLESPKTRFFINVAIGACWEAL